MSRTKQQIGQMGLFKPESDWVRPRELPDLRNRPIVVMDTETRDRGLANGLGPGWFLGIQSDNYVCGVAWAAEGSYGYAPTRHPESDNFDESQVMRWVADHHAVGVPICYHNGPYDVGWLGTYDVAPPDSLEDTLAAAVLLDETHRTYSLDACCEREGIPGKDIELLREAVRAYGGNVAKPAADLWRLPSKYAGPYAEQDCVATLDLWRRQAGQLRSQDLTDAYRLEMELIPMVVAMRRRGIRLNTDRALQISGEFAEQRDAALAEIGRQCANLRGAPTMENVRSPGWLDRVLQNEGITAPRTATGQASRSKDWMEKHEHWLPRLVTRANKFEEASTKFIHNYLLGFVHRGRLHAEVHQFLSEEGGTRSHRFSYSEPPLQQMPSTDKDPRDKITKELVWDDAVGTKIRDCFEPERGALWGASDYSGQETRIAIHFASECRMPGAERMVATYHENPRTDYHQIVADMTGLPRWQAKIINFAIMYGKGVRSLAEDLGLSLEEAKAILAQYHERMPFVKALEDLCKRKSSQRGYIRLIDGARMHYTQWEGGWIEFEEREAARRAGKNLAACSLEDAKVRQADPDHPWARTRLRRADTRKSFNNLVQGSAARQTKRAMHAMWREGILPLIQMHDEIGHSCADARQAARVAEIMRDACPLAVPVVVDNEFGPTWGRAKKSWDEAYAAMAVAA